MPAKIIQTNQTPFKRVKVDPITLDIVENALRNARAEMDAVLFRTAMSCSLFAECSSTGTRLAAETTMPER